jgi:aminoglycoside 6'-N-acetyltransferase
MLELTGPTVHLTTTTGEDGPALHAIHTDPAVSEFWDLPDEGFPMEDEPETRRLTIRANGEIAGLVQFGEEEEPKYRHAWIDIFVAPSHQGRGVGTEAIRLVIDHLLVERGHHPITIDPAAHNEAAVRCYTKAGFEPTGILHLAERSSDGKSWHDALFMELVIDPVTREPVRGSHRPLAARAR